MDQRNMNAIEHLNEMRKRIIFTLIIFLLLFCLAFVFVEEIYQFLVKDLNFKLVVLGPSDVIYVYVILSGISAIAVTIPVAAHQIWLFVKPALSKKEQKLALAYIPALFLLFIAGISFGYFLLFPLVLTFLMSLSTEMFQAFFTTEKYFRFLLQMTLPFGILFELPVVIMFLTSLGVINPYRLQKIRKYAYFVLIVISVFITPPDFISDVLVIIPLILLYEGSVSVSKIVYKRKQRNEQIVDVKIAN
ncbi:twin-arginine translocase subunit TatC [Bacillus massiliigorillae]|uniref:twin-arginine translocase subunit TatC n=1 Tax=Bacillus massiliigorillae TaxID=1243664 RepID=UPI0003A912F0|nr:twin-arginine translocase subunit TatC [Bacillus massiliigorillae]